MYALATRIKINMIEKKTFTKHFEKTVELVSANQKQT
jgi:hypothetical protein